MSQLTLLASLEGSFDAPRLTGEAVLANGRLRPLASAHGIEALNGRIRFDESGINLDGVTGRVGGGEDDRWSRGVLIVVGHVV